MGCFHTHALKSHIQKQLMKKVIVDTNFLMMPFEYGVDSIGELLRLINEPVKLVLPSGVLGELCTLSGRTGRRAQAARSAIASIEKLKSRFEVEEVKSEGAVDGWIIKYAQSNKILVATNDVLLRRRLRALGVPVVAMLSKAKLDFA
jgi:uncharacterized protein